MRYEPIGALELPVLVFREEAFARYHSIFFLLKFARPNVSHDFESVIWFRQLLQFVTSALHDAF